MMLPEDILNIIFEYGGYKTMFFDKIIFNKILSIRKHFREKPLKIKYNLFRWKEKRIYYDDGIIPRPSFYKEPIKTILLDGKISIYKIDEKGNISPSILLKDKIIPLSDTKISYINDCGIRRTTYWTIDIIKIENINEGILYKLVWN